MTPTLEQTASEKSAEIPKGFIQCTYNPRTCRAIIPEEDAKYQGSVVLCPDCHQRWFDTED